jgi:cyclophilin family peptidyl-prolyl cis-trans isomerase
MKKKDVRVDCDAGAHDIPNANPDPDPQAPDSFVVTFETTASKDPIVLEVHREWSPLGVDRFYQLVTDRYYTCASFFRVVPGFVVQFGIAAEPEETEKWDTEFQDDTDDETDLQSNLRSYVSFATAGPDTRTTQLFINVRDNANLDKMGFTPFAVVVEGMDVVDSIMNPTPHDGGGIDQGELESQGNEWLLENYPDIDLILSTAHIGPGS